jgi:hypothetical protein
MASNYMCVDCDRIDMHGTDAGIVVGLTFAIQHHPRHIQ